MKCYIFFCRKQEVKDLKVQNFSKMEQCVRHNTSPIACVTILISNHDEKCNSFFISSKPKFGAISRKKRRRSENVGNSMVDQCFLKYLWSSLLPSYIVLINWKIWRRLLQIVVPWLKYFPFGILNLKITDNFDRWAKFAKFPLLRKWFLWQSIRACSLLLDASGLELKQ